MLNGPFAHMLMAMMRQNAGMQLVFSFRLCEETDGHIVQRLRPKTERSLTYTLQALSQTAG